jgi:DNA segregation ATPase FtsK/SpoIIIE, S-DNA-T family
MAKKDTSIKEKKAAAPSAAPKASRTSPIAKGLQFIRSERGRKSFALGVILMSAITAISFISYFFTGYQDQTMLEAGHDAPRNWLGAFGAWVSQLFVGRGFGAVAILIPAYVGLWGFALLERKHFDLMWRLFKHVLFVVLWGSAFLGFVSYLVWGQPSLLGGGFGWYLNETVFHIIGRIGMGLLVVISFLIYLVVNFNVNLPILSGLIGKDKHIPADVPAQDIVADATPVTAETLATTDELPKDAEETEPETEYTSDFVLSVRKVGEPEKLETAKAGDTPDSKGEPAFVIEDGTAFLNPMISLPGPDQISELPTYRDNDVKFEFAIEDTRAADQPVEVNPVLATLPEVIALNGDNIHKVEDDRFEKIIPENSQEVVEEDQILAAEWERYDPTLELRDYQYPTIDLLPSRESTQNREVNRGELEENKNKIVQTLMHYKIDIQSIKATIGPTVTLYEIVPAPGVRISKIRNLEDDIALSLAALGIRIIAPIPGKGTIGIEIPNSNPEIVAMRSVMATEKFRDTKAELPLVLGRTISNEVYIADLTKMPHLLIAGATGQGKSVGINGILTSILYKKHPSQVKLVLIDPKKVELNLYSALERHFLAKLEHFEEPIITDTKQVIHVLKSLCAEMDSRYDLLKMAGARNLREYNDKFMARRLNPRKGHRFMPYIVLVIDEFADLMMTAGKEIEAPIARLAQLARAIGIHLILATQRPSVNVITGIIKANFPARISFRVTSKVDSRTILDTGGADQLVGRGDLLLSTGSDLVRIQNAFVDTPEVERIVEFIASQRGYPDAYFLPDVPMDGEDKDDDDGDSGPRDAMFNEAARLVVRHNQGSTSLIQRRLNLGYNRAGRIIDQLERAGIVGPFSGSKAREVLVQDDMSLEQILRDTI